MNARPFAYSLYGLTVRSNRPVPGLRRSAREAGPTVTIDFAQVAQCAVPSFPPHTVNGCESFWRLSSDVCLLHYQDEMSGAAWQIETVEAGAHLNVRWTSSYQIDDIPSVLLGPGFASVLHLRRAFVLHASVVKIGAGAVLIVGTSGAGKSTTAAALVRRGFPFISDDVAVLESSGMSHAVHLGHAYLRIYDNSAIAAGWPAGLPRLFHHPIFDDKRYVDLADDTQDKERIPTAIRAIYVLERNVARREGSTIQPLGPRQALQHLLANVYCSRFLDDQGRQQCLRRGVALVNSVPMRLVDVQCDLAEIGSLADLIADDAMVDRCRETTYLPPSSFA
jgi:hypothetical protein